MSQPARPTLPALLTLNAGSSSLKFQLFELSEDLPFLIGGAIMDLGEHPAFHLHRAESGGDETIPLADGMEVDQAIGWLLDWLDHNLGTHSVEAAAHRIVHGGARFDQSIELDREAMAYLQTLVPLAPLHQPHNLKPVEALWRSHPRLRQFGCFDTAFHAGHGPLAREFALPVRIRDRGVRRYGFHGLSYAWIARVLARESPFLAAGCVVVAHLGSGASLCALKGGISIDTTMGLTALDGLPMGTRCGALDPGVILYLEQGLGLSAAEVEHMLYEESGLKGLSELSSDVKTLVESNDPRARFALDYFAYKTAQQVAAMTIALGRLDGIVFTGGVGENAASVREAILAHLNWLRPFQVRVIPANEERAMALDVHARIDAPQAVT